jgi:hypothetical protein
MAKKRVAGALEERYGNLILDFSRAQKNIG